MKTKKKQFNRKKRKGCSNFIVIFLLLSLFIFVITYFFFSDEEEYPRPYATTVSYLCIENGVDRNLVYAIMKQESDFTPDAVSEKGAAGLMQLMPKTASWAAGKMGIEYDAEKLKDAKYNLKIAIWYLKYLNQAFDGDTTKVIAAYNGGENNVRLWVKEGTWDGTLANASAIPFGETAQYLIRVSENYKKYQEIY